MGRLFQENTCQNRQQASFPSKLRRIKDWTGIREVVRLRKEMNYSIIRKLVRCGKKSPLVRGEIGITQGLANLLYNNFSVSGRFKIASEFIKALSISESGKKLARTPF